MLSELRPARYEEEIQDEKLSYARADQLIILLYIYKVWITSTRWLHLTSATELLVLNIPYSRERLVDRIYFVSAGSQAFHTIAQLRE